MTELRASGNYDYDAAGRLERVERNNTLVVGYTYDDNGNRLLAEGEAGLVTATYDAQDRLLTYGAATYTYRPNGELASKTVGGQTTTYDYDTLGNLIEVVLPNGDEITYTVDGRGRRAAKAVNGVRVKGWLYADQLRPVAELDGSGKDVSRFVYGARLNVPEYVIKEGVTYRIFSDHLGSPRIVANASTGDVIQRLDFTAFGEIIQDSNPGWQPFGFAAGLYDHESGLLRFGARDFDPKVGRWTTKDPIGFGGGQNLYAYVNNSPIDYIDPLGLRPLTPCERDQLRPFIPEVDLDRADIREWPPKLLGFIPIGWLFSDDVRAVTLGNRIYFKPDEYVDTIVDIALLGHELVHVGQFREGMSVWNYLRNSEKWEGNAYGLQLMIEDHLKQ